MDLKSFELYCEFVIMNEVYFGESVIAYSFHHNHLIDIFFGYLLVVPQVHESFSPPD